MIAAALSGALPPALRAATNGAPDLRTLDAYADILLPADDRSPAASQLGVAAEIIDLAADAALFRRLLTLGTQWLNETGPARFHDLGPDEQTRVVNWMSRSDFAQFPGRFHHLMRMTAVEIYYSRTEALAGFPLNAAPQPRGYPPPWT